MFRDEIMRGNPNEFFVLHCDVICEFPLLGIQQCHRSHGKACTILGKKVPAEEAKKYGCLAFDPQTNEVRSSFRHNIHHDDEQHSNKK